MGAEKDSPALTDELIYFDRTGAICRCLNWREAQRTMLTDTTTEAVFFIEGITKEQSERVALAGIALKQLLEEIFSISVSLDLLNVDQPKVLLN